MNGQKKLPMSERITELEKLVTNLQMAVNISQAMLKNMNSMVMKTDKEISNIMGVMNDLQYRTLSMIQNDVFNKNDLNDIADGLKLKDFNDASDREDADKGYTVGDITTEDSIVIITSITNEEGNDSGLFRSKIAIKDTMLPELKEKLVGIKVGDCIKAKINGVEHEIELLGIRETPIKENNIPMATAE